MIISIKHIEQPISGIYDEVIYDIKSPWNSSYWTWLLCEEENSTFCAEFRGKYRGAIISRKFKIIVVLTTDYLYILDPATKKILEYEQQPTYVDLICTPLGDIFISDGYSLEMFTGNDLSSIETIMLPINPVFLRFGEVVDNVLTMKCQEFLNWSQEMELHLDINTMDVTVENTSNMKID